MKLIVWDFDGTLADSRPLIEAGMDHALGRLGLLDRKDIRQAWLRLKAAWRGCGILSRCGLSSVTTGQRR
ncbi:MAG: hypothetical protein BWY56_01417 [Acidobacteria bacterium ADurb.Bin340]|nr:MAG: hypothetical protein BWY56_01417 [Acidobacteria bacterium ADurb.Bin340]